MDTTMRIKYASSPVEHSNESDLKSDAHRMHIAFDPPPEVVWKRIETGLHYYS